MNNEVISRSIQVSNWKGESFIPEGYTVHVKFTTHVNTGGIIGSQDITLTSEEVAELLAGLRKVAKQLGIK